MARPATEIIRLQAELAERKKELNCFYGISRLLETPGLSPSQILQGIVDLIPPACQFPESVCARIDLGEGSFKSANYIETPWAYACEITLFDKPLGCLTVFSLVDAPQEESWFLKEEQLLLKAIAERLGRIWERMQAEESIRISAEKYRNIFTNIQDVYYETSVDGILIEVSPSIAETSQWSREDLIGRSMHALYIDPEQPKRLFEALLEKGKISDHEIQLRDKDGRPKTCSITTKLIRRSDGKPAKIIGSLHNITDRKQIERDLNFRVNFDDLVTKISTRFINLEPSKIDQGLNWALEAIGLFTEVDRCFIVLLSQNLTVADNTHQWCAPGVDACDRELENIWAKPMSYFVQRLKRSEIIYIPTTERLDPELSSIRPYLERQRIRSLLAVPLFCGASFLGFWGLESLRKTHFWPENSVSLLKIIGEILANALEHKRAEARIHSLSQELIKVQESERARIARDLHDRVAQDLSSLKIATETLFDDQSDVAPHIRQRMQDFSHMLQNAISGVRTLAYNLRPPGLDRLGLVSTVFQYCEDFEDETGIRVDFNAAGMDSLGLDYEIKINMFRLIQEALNNIKQHSEATRVTLRMVASSPLIIIRLEDNGKGFDVQGCLIRAMSSKHMGLINMEERVSLLGGDLDIQSRILVGTKIRITIPYTEKRHAKTDPNSDH